MCLKYVFIPTIACALLMGGTAASKTWYVYPNGVGGNAPTLQAAVDSAALSGDNIMLKGGVYRETGVVVDGKAVLIDQFEGQVYMRSPVPGSGTCIAFRNIPAGFSLNALSFRGFETAVAIEDASGYVQWPSIRSCGCGIAISGASSALTVWYALVDSCSSGIEVDGGADVVIQNETIVHCSTGIAFNSGSATLSRSIVYACATGVSCTGGAANLSCNNFFLNGADYAGCTAGATDFYSDPMFCFAVAPSPGLYWLHADSPCFTAANPCGVRVGAIIGAAGCTGTAADETSWGALKEMYR
jgi:hypothetical protein